MSVRCVSSKETVNNAICADSMHVVRHAIVEVNVVIGVLVVHGELLVVVRVVPVFLDCDDAVVHRIRVLIAFTVAIVFIVAILRRILLYWRYSVYIKVILFRSSGTKGKPPTRPSKLLFPEDLSLSLASSEGFFQEKPS